ncbi:pantoate--beta-alanine ligase [Parafrankia irregularis]|uniref:Pantothenate synthetase n=2 Tax=Parafrankia TaxID=2994362 RepID=A0A0S4QTI3_9ACTN|nr:pantoate--beta-alanine ligase [Parafrankia irregularis]MBE3204478.1 pantoate--beta-alanine ligase [Parafrankia sp. CH37]CUU57754.1 pantoate--beta-alanine ligase [Parafrankia irregularis]
MPVLMPAQMPITPRPAPAGTASPAPAASRGTARPIVVRTRAELAAALARPVVRREQTAAASADQTPPDHTPTDPAPAGQAPAASTPQSGKAREAAPARGVRGVVMTMGALHRGHAALIREARRRTDQVVVTIFVNPLQFGSGEDLDRYPRTFAADLDVCASEGADIVYAPSVVHDPAPLVTLSAGPLGDVLEGASRPGHFDGMLTLVGTMFHLVRPDVAFFGRKDAQQLVCIRRMVDDLAFPLEIVGVPTVRDTDGLALSSRNAYLDAAQRRSALALSRALAAGAARATEGADAVLTAARAELACEPGVDVDYLTLASRSDLGPVSTGPALLLVAARVGTTRLIDNIDLVLADPAARSARQSAGRQPAAAYAPDGNGYQGV